MSLLDTIKENFVNNIKPVRPEAIKEMNQLSYHYLYRGLWRIMESLGQFIRLLVESRKLLLRREYQQLVRSLWNKITLIATEIRLCSSGFRYIPIRNKVLLQTKRFSMLSSYR